METKHARLSEFSVILGFAAFKLGLHVVANGRYGFHRDELSYFDDGQHLAWGYVDHPPLTGALAALADALFGESLLGLRLFAALASLGVLILTGLLVREWGGNKLAQGLAMWGVMLAPIFMISGVLFQTVPFDQFWWLLAIFGFVKVLKTDNPRYWLLIGLAIGLGLMTKYTIAFFVIVFVPIVLLTPARRHLASPWLWGSVLLAILIVVPNLIWQYQHDFITLDYLDSINSRDQRIGRTDDFLPEQILVNMGPPALPLVLFGLIFLFSPQMKNYRALAGLFFGVVFLFWLTKGRSYYAAPLYPMLVASGGIALSQWLATRPPTQSRLVLGTVVILFSIGLILNCTISLPLAPINSSVWETVSEINEDVPEMIGWEELSATTAEVYNSLPPDEQVAILAGNYGEAGAINLYGDEYGLPKAISAANTYYLRGYGENTPETLVILGFPIDFMRRYFASCEGAGIIRNKYDVKNEEALYHPLILICRDIQIPFDEFWETIQSFN